MLSGYRAVGHGGEKSVASKPCAPSEAVYTGNFAKRHLEIPFIFNRLGLARNPASLQQQEIELDSNTGSADLSFDAYAVRAASVLLLEGQCPATA